MTKKKLKGGQWQTITHPHASLLASWILFIFKRLSKICFHILPIRISLLQVPLWIKLRPKAFGIFLKLCSKTVPFHAETQAWKKISHTCIYVVVSYIHVLKSSIISEVIAFEKEKISRLDVASSASLFPLCSSFSSHVHLLAPSHSSVRNSETPTPIQLTSPSSTSHVADGRRKINRR